MAITKERLQELINEGATIWVRNDYQTYEINTSYFVNIDIIDNVLYCGVEMVCLDYLYETKEQAEWHLKYHATRTEELNLPYWADIVEHKDDDIYKIVSFRRRNGMSYNLLFRRGDLMLWSVQELMNVWIDLATEENYTELCDLCLKLFKGATE